MNTPQRPGASNPRSMPFPPQGHNVSPIKVLEDFDDGNKDGFINGNAWTVVSSSKLEGTHHLGESGNTASIRKEGHNTFRGKEYRCRWIAESGNEMWFFAGEQAVSAGQTELNDGYFVRARVSENDLRLSRFSGGTVTTLASASVSVTNNTEFRLGIEYGECGVTGNMVGKILDSDDNVLQSVSATDDTFVSGTYQFYAGGDISAGDIVDYITERPI